MTETDDAIISKGTLVYPRANGKGKHGKPGKATGGRTRRCGIEDCCGELVAVRWPDGRLTFPCTAGMANCEDGTWAIL